MSDDAVIAERVSAAPLPAHARLRDGMRQTHNWVQLAKFCVVGGSGYAINLGVFSPS